MGFGEVILKIWEIFGKSVGAVDGAFKQQNAKNEKSYNKSYDSYSRRSDDQLKEEVNRYKSGDKMFPDANDARALKKVMEERKEKKDN